MLRLSAFIAGLIFGLGLILSGMSNPAKVLGFLDILGMWDPSLGFVMGGAIVITLPAFWLLKKQQLSWLKLPLQWPNNTVIDKRLVMGSSLFGIGWGLAGFCPGPAILSLASLTLPAMLFVIAMLTGMVLFQFYEHIRQ